MYRFAASITQNGLGKYSDYIGFKTLNFELSLTHGKLK